MKFSFKNTVLALVTLASLYACSGNAGKNTTDTTITKVDSFTVHIDSSARKTERTVKAVKSAVVDPETQDSIITEDSVIKIRTVIKHSAKK